MQGATLLVREVVTFTICYEVDDRPVPQSRRFVENNAPVFNACSRGLHGPTILASAMRRNLTAWTVTVRPGLFRGFLRR
jgi:hypothetical protein